jgi:hypothetical protein
MTKLKPDLAEAAKVLRRLLADLDRDEANRPNDDSRRARYRIEGAVIALEALSRGRTPSAGDLLTQTPIQ